MSLEIFIVPFTAAGLAEHLADGKPNYLQYLFQIEIVIATKSKFHGMKSTIKSKSNFLCPSTSTSRS
jgi:hypothetical protein